METNFKLKLSKLFQSSFTSCRSKHISDVADQPFFFPENHHHRHLISLFSPKPKTHFPKPPEKHISDQKPPFPAATLAGKPSSASFHNKKPKPTKKNKPHNRKPSKIHNFHTFNTFQSVTDNYYYDCCSSDEEDDPQTNDHTTLFSSDSTISYKRNKNRNRRDKIKNGVVVGGCRGQKATDVIKIKGKFVKDSVAVVKKSSDPHEDFRVSMLEMIVERQIFGVKDLENLLKCFLSLNCEEHHKVICEVYTEIWETLFSDWI